MNRLSQRTSWIALIITRLERTFLVGNKFLVGSFLFKKSFLLSSLKQTSGQAVVTGVYPSPPRCVPCFFLSRIGFISIPTARRFSSNVANSRSLSRFPLTNFLMQENAPTSMHSVRLEPTNLVLISTRITYQGTGDADLYVPIVFSWALIVLEVV